MPTYKCQKCGSEFILSFPPSECEVCGGIKFYRAKSQSPSGLLNFNVNLSGYPLNGAPARRKIKSSAKSGKTRKIYPSKYGKPVAQPAVSTYSAPKYIPPQVTLFEKISSSVRLAQKIKLKWIILGGILCVSFPAYWLWALQFETRDFEKTVLEENFSNPKKRSFTKGYLIKDGGLFFEKIPPLE